jgi:hypothetical protein
VIQNTPLCQNIVTKDFDPWFSDDTEERKFARGVCKVCPIWAICMTHALINNFAYGIFAGLDPDERKPLREKMFQELDPEHIAALTDKYFIPDIMEPEYASASVEAKYQRRGQRAKYCHEQLMEVDPDEVPHYGMFLECVEAVMDNPTGTGEELGRAIGRSGAMFNQRLRECFEFFGVDLSVL